MPVPKRRTGKTRRNTRRAHDSLTPRSLSECPNCGSPLIPHRVCKSCGWYKDRYAINAEE